MGKPEIRRRSDMDNGPWFFDAAQFYCSRHLYGHGGQKSSSHRFRQLWKGIYRACDYCIIDRIWPTKAHQECDIQMGDREGVQIPFQETTQEKEHHGVFLFLFRVLPFHLLMYQIYRRNVCIKPIPFMVSGNLKNVWRFLYSIV